MIKDVLESCLAPLAGQQVVLWSYRSLDKETLPRKGGGDTIGCPKNLNATFF